MKRILSLIIIALTMQNSQAQAVIGHQAPIVDPYNVKEFTLKNGLKVFISVNRQQPRIQTMIAVKAGSKFDPATTTGLAHYLEHMMFKGTSHYGTVNWEREKVLLDRISDLYEKHLKETNPELKKELYAEIDKLSFEASKLAIPSEYDKMVGSIGASGTNAFTSNDMTVYVNDIPSNVVDKWAKLEAERFSTLVLRLFHTELETVYEEFNRNQDDDIRWSSFAVDSLLMPNHPYGTQTTIGLGEHLKNPSMVNIHRYFDTYYRPNNVAVILVGDVDEKTALAALENTFGNWQGREVPKFVMAPPVPITEVKTAEVKGPTKEHVYIGFRFAGAGTHDALMARMIDMVLSNGAAGLIDMNIMQKQKALAASSYVNDLRDYSIFKLYGEPKAGQTLEEVKDLLLQQVEAVKRGEFDENVLSAVITNMRLQQMLNREKNSAVAGEIMSAFVKDIPWLKEANEIEEMAKITKAELVQFANDNFKQNYAVCYKRSGAPNRHKVDKPKITPVVLNKDSISEFKKNFDAIATTSISPKFLDFNKDIEHGTLNTGTAIHLVKNTVNRTFSLTYSYNTGSDYDKELAVAAEYAALLGTDKLSLSELKKEFFAMGLSYSISVDRDRIKVNLRGLEANMDKGMQLLHDMLQNLKADDQVYAAYVGDLLKRRANAKLNKGVILQRALMNYAKYGPENPFTNILTEEQLKAEKPETLLAKLKQSLTTPDEIFSYGTYDLKAIQQRCGNYFTAKVAAKQQLPAFTEKEIAKPVVYFCNYDMKQAEVVMMARDGKFNRDLLPMLTLYNDYYGQGLSSILFQEVREKMGLAYAVSSSYQIPPTALESHYLINYVGTQADKLKTALEQMANLQTNMVTVNKQFEGARTSISKNIESDWQNGETLLATYERQRKRGINEDLRREIYNKVKVAGLNDLNLFFTQHIKAKLFAYLVIGKKENMDFELLKSLGEVKELSLQEVFGY
ncbi:MAG: insulinase family protein [Chitinophagales bacterium]